MDPVYENAAYNHSTAEFRGDSTQQKGLTLRKRSKVLLIVLSVSVVIAVGGLCLLGVLYLNIRGHFESLNAQHEMLLMQLSAQEINNTDYKEQLETLNNQYKESLRKLRRLDDLIRSHSCEPCADGWTAYDGNCYFFSCEMQTWFDSNLTCGALDAHLVIIETEKEQVFLRSKIKDPHWIGLNDLDTEGRWVWVNNQTLEETGVEFWQKRASGQGEPDNWKEEDPSGENCAYLGAVNSELVDFSECSEFFFNRQSPVIPGILEKSDSQNNNYQTICQKYDGMYRFATLYDTTHRIPVFSAYKVTADVWNSETSVWMEEPKLELPSDEMGMPYENQATDEDYIDNNLNVNRGHLFPSCHSGDKVISRSTYTLTNTVPQKKSFNSGSWNRMEMETIMLMTKNCHDSEDQNKVLAHVLTGAVPGNNKLNERVNIPSFMWMTFCCYNISSQSWISQAYWAPNQDENEADDVTINEITLQELQILLDEEWVNGVQLFYSNCNKEVIFHWN
ncbi:Endonuclease domain-containing 1 protein [Triplophysa tibetana]|uniref:Endonuclease domain-containing 1 protein n=1 Tax=Triplophysa tibetana TaxID=1572043 RepID=A0A5A9NKL2_9TELE|nr:Endonuclease domain-containing 1 protein [Triplophysa tibetana]